MNDRPDYDYADGAALHLYELADGASCTCRLVDQKGGTVANVTACRNADTISFTADADMKGLTLVLHGIGGNVKQTEERLVLKPKTKPFPLPFLTAHRK